MVNVCFSISDPPNNVQLTASNAIACQDDVISLNCSAHSKPPILTYHMYENDTLMSDVSSSGIWKRKMPHGGIFVYKCVAKNSGDTGNSTSVAVIVNGKKSQNDFTIVSASLSRSSLAYSVLVCLSAPPPRPIPPITKEKNIYEKSKLCYHYPSGWVEKYKVFINGDQVEQPDC